MLQERIQSDLKTAMVEKNQLKRDLLRVVIGEMDRNMDYVPGGKKETTDESLIRIIKKMRENALSIGNKDEVEILEEYLPQNLSEDEVRSIIKQIIGESDQKLWLADVGVVMKKLQEHPQTHLIDKRRAFEIVKYEITLQI